ncbi:MAG: flagellar basal body-associated FliL family protein [Planctomycetaceae bacterium]
MSTTAASENSTEEAVTPKRSRLPWVVMCVVSAGAGVAVPLVMTPEPPKEPEKPAINYEMLEPESAMFVPFGDVTVNLNEGRMNRYLRLKVSLQIDKTQEPSVTAAVAQQGLVLRNWLISHLSDKELDAIRGAAGQNMLRREIRDQFNTVLFADGIDRIHDVLFEEFNVQ